MTQRVIASISTCASPSRVQVIYSALPKKGPDACGLAQVASQHAATIIQKLLHLTKKAHRINKLAQNPYMRTPVHGAVYSKSGT